MFQINRKHPMFDTIRFLLSAVSKEKSRYMMTSVYANGGEVAATDGRRLHIIPNFGLDNGLWMAAKNTASEVILVPDTDGGTFPPYTDVRPSDYPWETWRGNYDTNEAIDTTRFVLDVSRVTNRAISYVFLQPLLDLTRSIVAVRGAPFHDARPLEFDLGRDRYAVVLPFPRPSPLWVLPSTPKSEPSPTTTEE